MKSLQFMRAFRQAPLFSANVQALAIRGPKKKKGGGGGAAEKPLTNDIVNIFKERPDPKIHPTDAYPAFVAELLAD